MKATNKLIPSATGEYICLKNIDLYSTEECSGLATQAAIDRHLKLLSNDIPTQAIEVCLCEDDYPGWMKTEDLVYLEPSSSKYKFEELELHQIQSLLPEVIEFTHRAMSVENHYLWGGTVAPDYDCSGLMQAAFSSVGIWLPRDAYQQQIFAQPISQEALQPGDLIFFSKDESKITHVGLYLGSNRYIHSSGKDIGRNGIGINELSPHGDRVSQAYYAQYHSAGRIIESYRPTGNKWTR